MAENILHRKIGNKTVVLSYGPGAKKYAEKKLDIEESEYMEACAVADMSVIELVDKYRRTHEMLEGIKQDTCSNCGMRTLKERKNRMRVFGGLFWTDSQVAPYKHCTNCGHDQEQNPYSYVSDDGLMRRAERRIQQAKQLKTKYE